MLIENNQNSGKGENFTAETQQQAIHNSEEAVAHYDAVIVGAGYAGMYMLYKLRNLGMKVKVIEAGDGVGGTWYWNRYPGARCDVYSMDYSYSFDEKLEQEWKWSERYAAQPELLQYANHVADRYNLRPDIQFSTRVTSTIFNEVTHRWTVKTDKDETLVANFCIMATGCLSSWQMPKFKGMETFKGKTYHTGNWPHEGVDFTGKRVAIIGTGSSAIQSIPVIAEQAAHLYVYQRTPNFSVPAMNGPLDPAYEADIKSKYREIREAARMSFGGVAINYSTKSALEVTPEEREKEFKTRWGKGGFEMMYSYNDILVNREANETACEFIRSKVRELVHDPAIAEALCPTDHPLGSKRICVDTNYYTTFNRPNVTLVNVRNAPIEEITAKGVKTPDTEYEVDAIVFATGFDAMTGTLLKIDIQGRQGETLKEAWEAGPRTYLGLGVAGFPNMFTITGPGSPSVLSNMLTSIEQHVEWITDCLTYMQEQNISLIEPALDAQDAWVEHVNEVANTTLYPQANSWYLGANVPGKPRVFMPYVGGVGNYRLKCDEVAAKGYEGFKLTPKLSGSAFSKDDLILEKSTAEKIPSVL